MTFGDIEQKARAYYPAFVFEKTVSSGTLNVFYMIFVFTTALSGAYSGLVWIFLNTPTPVALPLAVFKYADVIFGIFLVSFAGYLALWAFRAFHNSFYFLDIDSVLAETGRTTLFKGVSYEVASIVFRTDEADITGGFLSGEIGKTIIARAGISEEEHNAFLGSRKARIAGNALTVPQSDMITLSQYAKAVYEADKEFAQFLFTKNLQEKDFVGTAEWVEWALEMGRSNKRRWSKDHLGRIPSIGKAWSYGSTFLLERFARDLTLDPIFNAVDPHAISGKKETDLLETILSQNKEANAMLVGEEGVPKLEIVARLARKIENGTVLPPIEHKKIFILNGPSMVAANANKAGFEAQFTKFMKQAVRAGNIILVLEDLPGFMASAGPLGSDIEALLDPYLVSRDLQVVGISDTDRFHASIEPNGSFMKRFETIMVGDVDKTTLLRILEEEALRVESKEGIFFTHGALKGIADGAERYLGSGVLSDKAVDLLNEIGPWMEQKKRNIVTGTDVLDLIESKTGIPVGEVKKEEKEKLLSLEKILHGRIIGQEKAIEAIASAMRRARTGVGNPNRPMGSFLFLGPTGVGKTETAKALAAVFFGAEDHMIRLDMSEFRTGDALERLIGSFDAGKPGVLVKMLKQKPYGVLLLDEFEKTNKEVIDLFLQVLDEGFFSDMAGKRINARNTIIIATSNAGSDIIWNYFKQGIDLQSKKDELVDMIIRQGLFKPELLNRFDGVIIFRPLGDDHIGEVARLMLEKLKARFREKGFDLVVNDVLVKNLIKYGYDPEFGARAMNRAMQEKIEGVIAEKLIRDEVKPGTAIELTEADFAEKTIA